MKCVGANASISNLKLELMSIDCSRRIAEKPDRIKFIEGQLHLTHLLFI